MANAYYNNNFYNDAIRERNVVARNEFYQARRVQAQGDDEIRVRANRRLTPVYQPQPFDDNGSDEHTARVFGRGI
jgi:hypothetical protein